MNFVKSSTATSTSAIVKGNVLTCFFTYTITIDILLQYPHALLMDFTYKTNRFGMPLLHVVGHTRVYTSFSACFYFLMNEDIQSYKWAQERVAKVYQPKERHSVPLSTHPIKITTDCNDGLLAAIDRVFSQSKSLICRWNIAKNSLENCRQHFLLRIEMSIQRTELRWMHRALSKFSCILILCPPVDSVVIHRRDMESGMGYFKKNYSEKKRVLDYIIR